VSNIIHATKHVIQQLINTLELKNIYLFDRDSNRELFIAHIPIGIVVTCSLLDETEHSEVWQVIEWSPNSRLEIISQHVFVCRFELLSWLSDKFLSLKQYGDTL